MANKLIQDIKRRMDGALTAFHNDLKGVRTGRASTGLIDHVMVEAYGAKMPVNQVGTVNVPEARMITVQVWDQGLAGAVERAIANADLGLNPSVDGGLVRIPLPDLSEERRKELVKVIGQYAEKARVAVRNIRRDGMESLKKMEKGGEISEDEHHSRSEEIQKITDEHVEKVNIAFATKEKDIMAV